ncbi:hypothetical protein UlMin_013143 [Ulmus minor]
MELNSATNAFKCRAFVITLTGVARRWFRTLRPGTISSFRQLSESFISQFAVHKIHRKPARHLYTITQRENETTESYLTRFVKEEMNVQDRSDAAASGALMAGLRNSTVLKYLVSVGKPDTVSYPELITEIRRHIDAEKASNLDASKLSQDILLGGGKRKIDSQVSRQDDGNNGKKNKNGEQNGGNNNNRGGPPPAQIPRFREYTPLTETVATVFNQAEHQCRVLKDEVERLIQRGQLREFVRGANQQPRQPAQPVVRPQQQDNHDLEVRTIMGGPATGETNRARKNYARQSRTDPFPHQVNLTGHKEKIPRLSDDPIIFTESEARGLWHPHTDAIVVTLRIAGRKVFRILVDNGSSADILFKSTFNRMNLVGVKIEPTSSSLSGFTGDSISSEGILNLPVELGSSPCQHIQAVDFVLVDCPSPYNAIIGLYCYKVMPFGLKNAGATYQRLVNKMFKDQIGKTMKVYVDDMLVKSLKTEEHIQNLRETFEILRRYKMKLNPSKCAFGVSSGKFLGFMVNHRGIEANQLKFRRCLTWNPHEKSRKYRD